MPKPPVLPTVNWKDVFENGREFSAWLAHDENKDNHDKIREGVENQKLTPEDESFLADLTKTVHVIAIAEAWCGDVVRNVPPLQKLANGSKQVKVRYIEREQYPDVFVRFLTNGGEAIPKFVFLSEDFVECGNWGPMPDLCREWISRGKGCNDVGKAREKVGAIYEGDPDKRMVIDEIKHLLDIASTVSL